MVLNPNVLEKIVRTPFKVAEPIVKYEFIKMPDSTSTSFGHHIETGQVVPVTCKGKAE
jgi:acetoacetate decarboxylase